MNKLGIEVLAPAGSFESLTTAINAGCDAVYFGISKMNMRASAAANFKIEDMPEIVKICKMSNVRCYLTLNTLLYGNEIELMHEIIDKAVSSGINAVIASDIAVITYARSKNLEVHISTQLSISNVDTVKFYSQFADRVVLARELTLEQVKQICDEIKNQEIKGPKGSLVEVEVFAHGALCVAESGRCAMSLYCYNSSANRGVCTQICRRQYKVTDVEAGKELVIDNNYVMSSSDLCTIGMLDKLVDSGVTALKFEGRGRSPEYVDTVIKTYVRALNSIAEGNYTDEKIKKWNEDLKTVFNRGFTTNFYMGRKIDEWSGAHGSKATMEKTKIGLVERYYPKLKVVQVVIKAKDTIAKNEKYIIIGKTTGTVKGTLSSIWLEEKLVDVANQNDVITFKVDSEVKIGDEFYVNRKRTSLIPRGKEKLIAK